MSLLVHPTYFPSIITFSVIAQNDIVWEACDNFQKQTYRNRCYICTDQGKHMLNIPIKHTKGKEDHQKYSEIEMDNSFNWQKQHWRTLETAYRTSPFFEFYEDDLKPLFEEAKGSLFDFNLKTIKTIGDCLGIENPTKKTSSYEVIPSKNVDTRFLAESKRELSIGLAEYSQVFEERHGFISNLSILDLLFNEGTNALTYLKNQSLGFLDA
nr:WbqC family protein [uncultured Allomuricauda sp.]